MKSGLLAAALLALMGCAPDPAPPVDPLAALLRAQATTAPELPDRRARDPRLGARPPLPDEPTVTYPDASGVWRAEGRAQTFARSKERFAVQTDTPLADDPRVAIGQTLGPEGAYVFVRNPIAPLQGRASVARPAEEEVIDLGWPELLDRGFGPTWNDLASLGVTTAERAALQPTGATVEAFGHSFALLRGADTTLAWSADLHLPLYVERGGERIGELIALELALDVDALVAPFEAHPNWKRQDFVDWREDHYTPR